MHRRLQPALLALLAVASLTSCGGGSSSQSTTTTAATPPLPVKPVGPVTLSAKGLRTLVSAIGQPVYWAGPQSGKRYGLTRTSKGEVFLRYLPPGTSAAARKKLLTIGTYPFRGAFAATLALTKKPGAVSRRLVDGALLYYRRAHPVSVYLVYPSLEYQIEVFDPSATVARRLVLSGRIRPIR
jgi:hypothetical protein